MISPEDRRWLDAAARQATPFLGTTGQTPTVGAILVDPRSQALLGRGVTGPAGEPSAEMRTLDEAGGAARGGTLYLTLDPRATCLEMTAAAGIARIVIGATDPDAPAADGEVPRLAAAGIEIVRADHAPSKRLHEGYISRKIRGRPFVSARLAVSADGKAGLRERGDFIVAGEPAQRWTMLQRALADAVMIGWGTARLDNPDLAVRLPGLADRRPRRVVVAGLRAIETRLNLVAEIASGPVTIIATPEKRLNVSDGVEVLQIRGHRGRPDLKLAVAALGEVGVQGLFVEPGPTLLEPLLADGLIDRFHLLQSELVIGPAGLPATTKATIDIRLAAAGFSLVDHRLLGADNLRTFEKVF